MPANPQTMQPQQENTHSEHMRESALQNPSRPELKQLPSYISYIEDSSAKLGTTMQAQSLFFENLYRQLNAKPCK